MEENPPEFSLMKRGFPAQEIWEALRAVADNSAVSPNRIVEAPEAEVMAVPNVHFSASIELANCAVSVHDERVPCRVACEAVDKSH